MPILNSSVAIDGAPGDAITITGSFTCDTQDPQASVAINALTTAVNGRKGSATINVTNPDPATMLITITI